MITKITQKLENHDGKMSTDVCYLHKVIYITKASLQALT